MLTLKLSTDFPSDQLPGTADVPALIKGECWDELNHVPVCVDRYGQACCRFGDTTWDCTPYMVGQCETKPFRQLSFEYLADHPVLLLQAKLIVYGWLFHVGHCNGKHVKLITVCKRFNINLKKTLLFLLSHGLFDLTELVKPSIWTSYLSHLEQQSLSRGTLDNIFSALKAIAYLNDWLPFEFRLPELPKHLGKKLAPVHKQEYQQFLALPQRLANQIYGAAIQQVEHAWEYKDVLIELEEILQANFKSKKKEPQNVFIRDYLQDTGLLPDGQLDRYWYINFTSHLKAACLICCGAFTGMRISELFELRGDSYFTREINGQVFPVVRSSTFKLVSGGKKYEEWLCSPVVEKAIELAVALSAPQKKQLQALADQTHQEGQHEAADRYREISDCLWLTQHHRGSPPKIIQRSKWGRRLTRFCRSIGAIVNEADLAEFRLLNPFDNGAVDRLVVGQPLRLTPHILRRTFAVIAIRHNLCHTLALKQQFKHLSDRMARWYGNGADLAKTQDVMIDTELQQMIDDAKTEHTATQYHRFWNSDELLAGGEGNAIMTMRDNKPVIYSSWDHIYELVKSGQLVLSGTMHSYCKAGYACKQEGVVNPGFAATCENSIITPEQGQWWKNKYKIFVDYMQERQKRNDLSPNEYSYCVVQLKAAEQVLTDLKIPYEPYRNLINLEMIE